MLRPAHTSKEKTKKKKAHPLVWTGGIGKAFQKNTTPQVLYKSKRNSSGGDFFENRRLGLDNDRKAKRWPAYLCETFCEIQHQML
jgi:hypothetical protein